MTVHVPSDYRDGGVNTLPVPKRNFYYVFTLNVLLLNQESKLFAVCGNALGICYFGREFVVLYIKVGWKLEAGN